MRQAGVARARLAFVRSNHLAGVANTGQVLAIVISQFCTSGNRVSSYHAYCSHDNILLR